MAQLADLCPRQGRILRRFLGDPVLVVAHGPIHTAPLRPRQCTIQLNNGFGEPFRIINIIAARPHLVREVPDLPEQIVHVEGTQVVERRPERPAAQSYKFDLLQARSVIIELEEGGLEPGLVFGGGARVVVLESVSGGGRWHTFELAPAAGGRVGSAA